MSVTKPVWLNRAHLTSREWLKLIDANGVRLTVGETFFFFAFSPVAEFVLNKISY